MNIVFVTREYLPSKRAGGIATYVWETARSLCIKGHNVYVISASDDIKNESELIEDGVNVIRLAGGDFYISRNKINKIKSRLRSIFCYWSYRRRVTKRLNRLIAEKKVDIVEFAEYGNEMDNWLRNNPNQLPWVVRLHGPTIFDRATCKTVNFLQKPIRWFLGRREIRCALKANAISSPTHTLAELFLNLSCSTRLIEIIPNAVSLEDWRSTILTGKERNAIQIFSAGSIVEAKGFNDLLKACLILRDNRIDVNLTIAGKMGILGEQLATLAETTSYKNWFKVLGPIQRSELKLFYESSDIVVFPAWWENFPLVCVEAMATGALVVGSSSGGMAEIIEDGVDGFLIPPKSPQLLASKLKEIIDLPKQTRKKIRLTASEKVRNKYDVSFVLKQQIEFYESVINKFIGKE